MRFIVGARLVLKDAASVCLPTDRAAYGRLAQLLTAGNRRATKGRMPPLARDIRFWRRPALDRSARGPTRRIHGSAECVAVSTRGQSWRCALSSRRRSQAARAASQTWRKNRGSDRANDDCLYHASRRAALQDVLTCIREGCTIAEAGFRLEANAERHLKPPQEMVRLFRAAPEAVAETLRFAAGCRFSLDELSYEYPDEPVPAGRTPQDEHLADLTWEGAADRYPDGVPHKIRRRSKKNWG